VIPHTVCGFQTVHRTGPVGRLARTLLAGVFVLTLLSIVDSRGSAHFRNPHILQEPLAWILHLALFVVFVELIGALAESLAGSARKRRWQVGVVAASVAAITVAGVIGKVAYGAFWGLPLADLVWWFDVLVLVEQVIATLLAIALGTPGCEIGVWGELLASARGEVARSQEGLACIVGLHLVDAWEARRRQQLC